MRSQEQRKGEVFTVFQSLDEVRKAFAVPADFWKVLAVDELPAALLPEKEADEFMQTARQIHAAALRAAKTNGGGVDV